MNYEVSQYKESVFGGPFRYKDNTRRMEPDCAQIGGVSDYIEELHSRELASVDFLCMIDICRLENMEVSDKINRFLFDLAGDQRYFESAIASLSKTSEFPSFRVETFADASIFRQILSYNCESPASFHFFSRVFAAKGSSDFISEDFFASLSSLCGAVAFSEFLASFVLYRSSFSDSAFKSLSELSFQCIESTNESAMVYGLLSLKKLAMEGCAVRPERIMPRFSPSIGKYAAELFIGIFSLLSAPPTPVFDGISCLIGPSASPDLVDEISILSERFSAEWSPVQRSTLISKLAAIYPGLPFSSKRRALSAILSNCEFHFADPTQTFAFILSSAEEGEEQTQCLAALLKMIVNASECQCGGLFCQILEASAALREMASSESGEVSEMSSAILLSAARYIDSLPS